MGILGKLFGVSEPAAVPDLPATDEAPIIPTRSQIEKVDYHIGRFQRALDQCSNSARLEELRRNLEYWKAVKAASKFSKGAE